MKNMGKFFGLILFIFVSFIVFDILYRITGSLFVTLLIGSIMLLFFMRYKAKQPTA